MALDMSLVSVELMRPIPTHKTKILGADSPVTIDLPQTTTVKKRTALTLAAGEAGLIAVAIAHKNYLIAIVTTAATPPKK